MKTPILVGETFGRLTAIKKISGSRKMPTKWVCRCICGNTVPVISGSLRNGNTKSCGCLLDELQQTAGSRTRTHNMSTTRVYGVWKTMLNRCRNSNTKSFADYGGRGITVCERWRNFENFFADMGEPPSGMTLERRENSGNYEPSNCLWATRTKQMNNRRNNILVTHNGKTLSLSQWAREMGLPRGTVVTRFRAGHSPERIFDIKRRTNQYR